MPFEEFKNPETKKGIEFALNQDEQVRILKSFSSKYSGERVDNDIVLTDKESGDQMVIPPPKQYKTGEEYYSKESVAARQSVAKNKIIPSTGDIVKATPGGKTTLKALPMVGAGVASAFVPPSWPWYGAALAAGGGATLGKLGENKIIEKPLDEDLLKEALYGGVGGVGGKIVQGATNYVGKKMGPIIAEKLPQLAKSLYSTAQPGAVRMATQEMGKKFAPTLNRVSSNLTYYLENALPGAGKALPQAFKSQFERIGRMSVDDFIATPVEELAESSLKSLGRSANTFEKEALDEFVKTLNGFKAEVVKATESAVGSGKIDPLKGAGAGLTDFFTKFLNEN